MNKIQKQILIGATAVAFTACGGGSGGSATNSDINDNTNNGGTITGGSNSGASVKKLTKMTSVNEDGTSFTVSEYSYNANDLVEKSVSMQYKGDSIHGELKSKIEAIYTYEKTYNMVKVVTKAYDANNQLTMTSTSWQTYSGDKVISMKGKSESNTTEALNTTSEGNFKDYDGPIATKTTLDSFDKDKKLVMHSTGVTKVKENKDSNITSTTTIGQLITTSSILRVFDSLDRLISSELVSPQMKSKSSYSYDSDTNIIEPIYTCFGGYVQMAKNHRAKYPKAENLCYLKTGITSASEILSQPIEETVKSYENTLSNGLVVERKVKTNNELTMTYRYEYE